MAEAAFFYNFTTQRPDRSKPPSAHTNISVHSQAQPLKPKFRKRPSIDRGERRPETSSSSSSRASQSSHSNATTSFPDTIRDTALSQDRMISSPLIDYKLSANQPSKTKAAAAVAATGKTKPPISGNNPERKYATQTAEQRSAATTRGDMAGRSSSISSATGSSGLTAVTSSDPPPSDRLLARPFSRRNGRKHLRDATLPYPLPCDLAELHRQTMRTMLLCQVFNGPVCSPAFQITPPKRVLEVACGTGFWSVMCHRHFAQRGFSSIEFTGVDIAPLAPKMDMNDDMIWRFVQHDLRRAPFPFSDEEFDLIMAKDLSMTTPTIGMQQSLMDEYLRILKPGGTLEIWDGDHSLRMLLPHAQPPTRENEDGDENEEQVHTNAMGTYTITPQTPFAAPQNQFLLDYNSWITKALDLRKLSPMPCTMVRPMLLQEAEGLADIDSRRLAIPLGEVRWEREGVGGVVSGNELSNALSSKGKGKDQDRRMLTPGQSALRRTALMNVVQMIESLEPLLREASGKGQDEWDRWQGNMMNDLLKNHGASWGECLEVGAWWARKKSPA
ncbi:S-adenosyl-L-methionine-dependent methyltransferase-9 [Coleophoma crateriformis]|uniref:S-adenosyl-L-methionine-dependent methyltransferase-9 n=1 Tax=Coleophoma crateriformis TaxID=565419 RepID=A0A3D8SAU6_9HELO|nr:S-adenosyl-L-methionine-dependent methyltransferase-9 [Coleophoma crateriformis]